MPLPHAPGVERGDIGEAPAELAPGLPPERIADVVGEDLFGLGLRLKAGDEYVKLGSHRVAHLHVDREAPHELRNLDALLVAVLVLGENPDMSVLSDVLSAAVILDEDARTRRPI